MDKPRVLLSLPHMGSHHFANSTAVEALMMPDQRVQLGITRPSARPYENNLNQVIKKFIDEGWDYWINLDDDQAPINNPIDLVFLDKDIVGLPTPSFKFGQPGAKHPFFWSVYSWDAQERAYRPYEYKLETGPLQEVDAVGSGCWVVARRVLLALSQPLLRRYDKDGIVTMGCDLSFCTKAREQGFKIYAHYDYPCRHFKTIDVLEVMKVLAGET